MITVPKMSLSDAKVVLEAAERKAAEIRVPMDIAVVDDGGNLMSFHRMDGAKITGIEIAINKAFTAAGTRKGTHEYAAIGGPGGSAFGIHASHHGRFTIFGGGLPIIVQSHVVGGVGCSSGSAEQDQAVAQAGLDALHQLLG